MAELGGYPWFISVVIVTAMSWGQPALGQVGGDVAPVAEPGVLAEDGSWVLPITLPRDAAASSLDSGVITASRDGHSVTITELLAYPFRGGQGETTALVVLLDLLPLADEVQAAWVGDLASLVTGPAALGAKVSLATCGTDVAKVPRPGDMSVTPVTAVAALLAAPGQGRLWDSVIAAITALDESGLPERRVLLLVSDGREEVPSRHVMVSCVEAALRARVAVYVLSLARGPDADAANARLAEMVDRTGGRMLADEKRLDLGLAEILTWISAARGLRLEADTDDLPVEITVCWGDESEPWIVGEVARRQGLGKSGSGHWVVAGCALLAVVGAGYLLWRQRPVMVGDLVVRTKNGNRRFPIPGHGVTIGRDPDNSLVLNSRQVSQHHAVIRIKGGDVIITDLRSSRGTKVNGEPIGTLRLESGDHILVGGAVEIVFKGHATAT